MPGIFKAMRQAASLARYAAVVRRFDDPMAALPYAYWWEKAPLRMELPVSALRMQGGFTYGPDHPFVQALATGKEALSRFYTHHAPENLGQMYGLPGGAGADLPPYVLPWRKVLKDRPPGGEKGLPASQGVAFYGPCTPKKVTLEALRLSRVASGIRKSGFQPDKHGDIEGHFITDGTRACFFVMGGKHRAAALAHLGNSHIPVRLRPGRMAIMDTRTAQHWPMVADGGLSPKTACAIADLYLTGRGMSDL
ncbi:hypothetical protein ACSSNL_09480 [Thalassobius sp. S69A]|uniref:hypothetical protein n=1 Tax=unclassified Thalassovita TaxID=2619711 RepID=UPI000C1139CF|nr:hypothetical protein [Paracoccaceae bacterium]MBT25958.1 hypothetical protein [Paracoccaceae bacterium]